MGKVISRSAAKPKDLDEALRERLGTRRVGAPLFGMIPFQEFLLSTYLKCFAQGQGPTSTINFFVRAGCGGVVR